jgi:hypothetical protein
MAENRKNKRQQEFQGQGYLPVRASILQPFIYLFLLPRAGIGPS